MPTYGWTQPCCNSCWAEHNPDREPVRTRSEYTDREKCVYCGVDTFSGIYVRVDPREAKHPSLEK